MLAQCLLKRGPIRIHSDLLPLIDMSSAASSVEQIVTSFCSDSIDGANSNVSSAYSIIDEHDIHKTALAQLLKSASIQKPN
jgi:hypothetical protein